MISPKVMTLGITLNLCYPSTNLTVFSEISVTLREDIPWYRDIPAKNDLKKCQLIQQGTDGLGVTLKVEAFGHKLETPFVRRGGELQHPALARSELQDRYP